MKQDILTLLVVGVLTLLAVPSESLEQGFADPPKVNRPQVWWWFDATAPDAAITRDLEGLKRVGISGFHIYGGSVTGKGWLPRAKWALHEANRLGLDGIVMIGAAGCGHAQTDPRHAYRDDRRGRLRARPDRPAPRAEGSGVHGGAHGEPPSRRRDA